MPHGRDGRHHRGLLEGEGHIGREQAGDHAPVPAHPPRSASQDSASQDSAGQPQAIGAGQPQAIGIA
jgi:hypothetical protein